MHVEISVFDIAGRKVTSLLEKKVPAGAHEVFWNGTDGRGKPVASGVYLCRLSAAGHQSSIKMVLLR
jgi:flagellar hook assembly protein FlgD